ncbi:flavodoxin [Planococcus sp. ISL-109]|uniref:flavodoxin family protein n=1 Tax=Planococcus sp. ISL-109 TaxID=2819166 RepID=UPI001BEB64C1|nr:flavodoxin [Planococcus sp. ISL-109]MBT2584105.1 flavodoxin family protein [Planococcus sp. ISL-109]
MKIGIIVHSQTGNTLLVGEKLLEKLRTDGHEVTLTRMQNIGDPSATQNPKDIELDSMPEVTGYDALIFGAWVQAFNLCPGFSKYLKQLPEIERKHVSCFVTQQFRYKWMGGSFALSKMKKLLAEKGVKVSSSGVINWSNKKKEQQIDELVARFSGQYEA